ncbi:MAG: DNA translocase FtsK 4TM domain-containing protein [Candidatus Pacebacteria bacterium]|nr:DNA translocase FtsK 4TM domain-containing protein [Candidatus Paceibacterota bacterium]
MGRKKKKEKKEEKKTLRSETVRGIGSVTFFVLGIFLVLSSFNKGGIVGEKLYAVFTFLVGIGYFLIPLVLFLLSIALLKELHTKVIGGHIGGAFLFLISGLGIVSVFSSDVEGVSRGGIIGNAIASPLRSLFDIYATVIFLFALLLISFLILFNVSLNLHSFVFWKRGKKENSVTEEDAASLTKEEEKKFILPPEDTKTEAIPSEDTTQSKEKEGQKEDDFFVSFARFGMKTYTPPPLSIFERDKGKPGVGDIKVNANVIKRTLQNFGIQVEMDEISIGPSVTRYALKPAEGVKLSRIVALHNDLALALAAHPLRIEAPIPGKSLVGIEIPNSAKTIVGLGTMFAENEYQKSGKALTITLGKGVTGKCYFANLSKMPHLLIAGATGSGKSVTIHSILNSLLFKNSPENLKFIMIDPKRVELTLYNGTPHLLTPVVTEAKKAILALKWAAREMDRRYDILEAESVRDIESYHKNILEPELKKFKEKKNREESKLPEIMPYIIIVIDEIADIMQTFPRELETAVVRLAQMSRAVGIHLILSTQRPSVNVITGLIKANIPSRIALQVSSQIDSRTILDGSGAEKLLGAGDMLYLSGDMSKPVRIQSAFVSETEVKKVVQYLRKEYENEIPSMGIDFSSEAERNSVISESLGEEKEDSLYEEAREVVIQTKKASVTFLQRKLRVGYARAARLVDMLEERGVVGPGEGAKPREVFETDSGNQQNEGILEI